jgi:hypothetical protein
MQNAWGDFIQNLSEKTYREEIQVEMVRIILKTIFLTGSFG